MCVGVFSNATRMMYSLALCGDLSLLCDYSQSSHVMWFNWCLILFGWRYFPHVVGLALVFSIFLSWTSHQILSIALFVAIVALEILLKWALLWFNVEVDNFPIWAFWFCFMVTILHVLVATQLCDVTLSCSSQTIGSTYKG